MNEIKPRRVDRTEIFDVSLDEDTILEVEYALSTMGKKDLPKKCPPFTIEVVEFLHEEKEYKYILHNGYTGPPFDAHPIEDKRLRKSLIEGLPGYAIKVIEQNLISD
jgi:hypothetical protein